MYRRIKMYLSKNDSMKKMFIYDKTYIFEEIDGKGDGN